MSHSDPIPLCHFITESHSQVEEKSCRVAGSDSEIVQDSDGEEERYEEALALARHGIVFRGAVVAMRQHLTNTQRCGPKDRQRASAARVNLAAALISWARRSPRPAQFDPMHREAEALLQAALADDPDDALALANLNALLGNRLLRRDAHHEGRTATDESEEDAEGDSGGGMAAAPQFLHAGSRLTRRHIHPPPHPLPPPVLARCVR